MSDFVHEFRDFYFFTFDKYLDTKWCIYCIVGHFSPLLLIEIGLWSIWPYLDYIYQKNLEHRPTVLRKAFMFWKTSLFRGFDTYSPVWIIIFQSLNIFQGYKLMISCLLEINNNITLTKSQHIHIEDLSYWYRLQRSQHLNIWFLSLMIQLTERITTVIHYFPKKIYI